MMRTHHTMAIGTAMLAVMVAATPAACQERGTRWFMSSWETGEPAAGLSIDVYRLVRPGEWGQYLGTTVTDENGVANYPYLSGQFGFVVQDGRGAVVGRGETGIYMYSDYYREVVMSISTEGQSDGLLSVEAYRGEPASIVVQDETGRVVANGLTDDQGRFIGGPPIAPGLYTLQVFRRGRYAAAADVEIVAGESLYVVVTQRR